MKWLNLRLSSFDYRLTPPEYRIKVRKGDFEFEVSGDKEFVEKKAKDLDAILKEGSRDNRPVPGRSASKETDGKPKPVTPGAIPKTGRQKLEKLRDDGFFSEPKESSDLVAEFRLRTWGVYEARQLSSLLINSAQKIGLRRISMGEKKYAYVYP